MEYALRILDRKITYKLILSDKNLCIHLYTTKRGIRRKYCPYKYGSACNNQSKTCRLLITNLIQTNEQFLYAFHKVQTIPLRITCFKIWVPSLTNTFRNQKFIRKSNAFIIDHSLEFLCRFQLIKLRIRIIFKERHPIIHV